MRDRGLLPQSRHRKRIYNLLTHLNKFLTNQNNVETKRRWAKKAAPLQPSVNRIHASSSSQRPTYHWNFFPKEIEIYGRKIKLFETHINKTSHHQYAREKNLWFAYHLCLISCFFFLFPFALACFSWLVKSHKFPFDIEYSKKESADIIRKYVRKYKQ